jgi:hypothetical protein
MRLKKEGFPLVAAVGVFPLGDEGLLGGLHVEVGVGALAGVFGAGGVCPARYRGREAILDSSSEAFFDAKSMTDIS